LIEEDDKKLPEFGMQNEIHRAKVLRVIDGDTVVVAFERRGEQVRYRIRFAKINAPEMKPRLNISKEERDKIIAEAKKSKAYVKDRIEGKIVTIQCVGFDNFGRLMANIYTDDDKESVNDAMLRLGLAVLYERAKKKTKSKTESKN
jgi:endonuclease YncB( thermonuclease family)